MWCESAVSASAGGTLGSRSFERAHQLVMPSGAQAHSGLVLLKEAGGSGCTKQEVQQRGCVRADVTAGLPSKRHA
jgi:hypothetical protein